MTTEVPAPIQEAPTRLVDPATHALREARAILIEKGWCQCHSTDFYGRHCALGAIAAVSQFSAAKDAHRRLRAVVGQNVPDWNDARDRTFADVIEAFGRAIGEDAR